jgi:hypothetical protein
MLILWLLLWMMAIILLITNRDEESTRWGSGIAIFSGCGGFAVAIEENISYYLGHLKIELTAKSVSERRENGALLFK